MIQRGDMPRLKTNGFAITSGFETETGLAFDTDTGVISGTPTIAIVESVYTITATNTGGSTSYDLTLTVMRRAPGALQYGYRPDSSLSWKSQNRFVFTRLTGFDETSPRAIDNLANNPSPQLGTGDPVATYSVNPSLPPGLLLDPKTGVLSGRPVNILDETLYRMSGTNSGGKASVVIRIAVNSIAPKNMDYDSFQFVHHEAGAQRVVELDTRDPQVDGDRPLNYSIDTSSKKLPAGLFFDTITGAVVGTPSATCTDDAPACKWTVTGWNSGGSVTTVLRIKVMPTAPSIVYADPYLITVKGSESLENRADKERYTPVLVDGDPPTAYTVEPEGCLPTGISVDSTDGGLHGSPTDVQGRTACRVISANEGGSASTSLEVMSVDKGPRFDRYRGCDDASRCPLLTTGEAAKLVPLLTINSGTPVWYSVSRPLIAGLKLDTTTGEISGVPLKATSEYIHFVVTAGISNDGFESGEGTTRTSSTNIFLRVNDPRPVLSCTSTGSGVSVSPPLSVSSSLASVPAHSSMQMIPAVDSDSYPFAMAGTSSSSAMYLDLQTGHFYGGARFTLPAIKVFNVTLHYFGGDVTTQCTFELSDSKPQPITYGDDVRNMSVGWETTRVCPQRVSCPNTPLLALPDFDCDSQMWGLPNFFQLAISPFPSTFNYLNVSTGCIQGTPVSATVVNAGPASLSEGAVDVSINPGNYGPGTTPQLGTTVLVKTSVWSRPPLWIISDIDLLSPVTPAGHNTLSLVQGRPIEQQTPVFLLPTDNADTVPFQGGRIIKFSVSPLLRAGLSFSSITGEISGTPTSTGTTIHTVDAYSSGVSERASLDLQIEVAQLFCGGTVGGLSLIKGTSQTMLRLVLHHSPDTSKKLSSVRTSTIDIDTDGVFRFVEAVAWGTNYSVRALVYTRGDNVASVPSTTFAGAAAEFNERTTHSCFIRHGVTGVAREATIATGIEVTCVPKPVLTGPGVVQLNNGVSVRVAWGNPETVVALVATTVCNASITAHDAAVVAQPIRYDVLSIESLHELQPHELAMATRSRLPVSIANTTVHSLQTASLHTLLPDQATDRFLYFAVAAVTLAGRTSFGLPSESLFLTVPLRPTTVYLHDDYVVNSSGWVTARVEWVGIEEGQTRIREASNETLRGDGGTPVLHYEVYFVKQQVRMLIVSTLLTGLLRLHPAQLNTLIGSRQD